MDASLVSPLAGEDDLDGLKYSAEIHPKAAFVDILEVELNHILEVNIRATAHLPITRKPRLNRQALHGPCVVLCDLVGQRRARTDHSHLSKKNVDELRKLINGVLAQELAHLGDARIVLHLEHGAVHLVAALQLLKTLVRILVHTAKLIHGELMHAPVAVRARNALLRIDGAARALQADRSTDDGARNQPKGNDGTAERDVEHAASSPIEPFPAIGIAQGTGTLKIEEAAEDVKASNAQTPEGFTEIGSFKVTCTGKVEAPYQFAYNLGAAYANAEVTIYVDHETEGVENEVINKTASSDGTVTFTTDALSIHTIVAKQSATKPATDTGAQSPQTGLPVMAVAGVSAVALGSALVLRKKVSE